MKIGLSYSRCVRDIVEGKVDITDVLIIISRTNFDPTNDEQWKDIWKGYAGGSNRGSMIRMFAGSNPEWASYGDEDEELFRSVSVELYKAGKLHQPRQFGANPRRMPQYWLETVLPNEELERNPAAKHAWEKFQMIAGLTSVELDEKYQ